MCPDLCRFADPFQVGDACALRLQRRVAPKPAHNEAGPLAGDAEGAQLRGGAVAVRGERLPAGDNLQAPRRRDWWILLATSSNAF